MRHKITLINPIEFPGWNEFIASYPGYSIFHTSNWARVLSESYNYKLIYFSLFNEKKLLCLIPVMEVNSLLTGKRGVSLPFSDYCEPYFSEDIEPLESIKILLEYGGRLGWKYFELRGGESVIGDLVDSYRTYYIHSLELSQNDNEIYKKFRDSTKRNVKKAIERGVKTEISKSLTSLKEFYRLHCMTRREHGLPSQPISFFRKVFDNIISNDLGFVALSSYKDKIIAGAIYFKLGDKAFYKYGASDKSYQHLRANNLVMWEAIRWFCLNGYKSFCFGRTEPENKGLLQFKAGWGTKEQVIKYYRYDYIRKAYILGTKSNLGLFNKVFNKMPIPILNIFGSFLYRHMG